jgi:hypothetical protein
MREIANVRVGKPDVEPDTPAHKRGRREGNKPGSFEKTPGLHEEEGIGKGTAQRSTGIDPDSRNPIDPESPNLSPA